MLCYHYCVHPCPCRCENCGGLLRPHVVWYGEGMEYGTLAEIDHALRNCDLYIQVRILSLFTVFHMKAVPLCF